MGTVLLMVKESWRLQPSPAGCGLGSVHFPLDMDLLWRVEVVPKLGWGRVHAEQEEEGCPYLQPSRNWWRRGGTVRDSEETIGLCAVWGRMKN